MSEIEKQFFETFDINKSTLCKYAIYGYEGGQDTWYKCTKRDKECWTYPWEPACKDRETDYPEITDRILLELIRFYLGKFKIDRFRRFILSIWIDLYEKTINTNEKKRLKRRVQSLFKENN